MIIDWYTIIFQIINFLVLVFLLRAFLYGPIIRAMDEREQIIVQREDDAEKQQKKAAEEAEQYRNKTEALEQQEEEMIEKARAKAEEEKSELLDQARQEVNETRRRWEEAFEREKETFIVELRRRIAQQACSVARSCLKDLADARLEELTWELFLGKLEELPEEERSSLQKALGADDSKLILRSAFEAPEKKLKEIEAGLKKILPDSDQKSLTPLTETDEALVCGLELEVGGYRVAWNIDSYLEDVEAKILDELGQALPGDESGEVPGGGEPENKG